MWIKNMCVCVCVCACVCVCEWKERIYSKRRDLKIKSNEKVEVNNWYVQSFWGYSGNELCRQHNFQEM